MDNARCMDRFIFNLIAAWLIACWSVMAVDCFSSNVAWLRNATPRVEIAVAASVAIMVLFAGPYVAQCIARLRPSPLVDDKAEKKAAFRGRLIGLAVGLLAGIMVQGM